MEATQLRNAKRRPRRFAARRRAAVRYVAASVIAGSISRATRFDNGGVDLRSIDPPATIFSRGTARGRRPPRGIESGLRSTTVGSGERMTVQRQEMPAFALETPRKARHPERSAAKSKDQTLSPISLFVRHLSLGAAISAEEGRVSDPSTSSDDPRPVSFLQSKLLPKEPVPKREEAAKSSVVAGAVPSAGASEASGTKR